MSSTVDCRQDRDQQSNIRKSSKLQNYESSVVLQQKSASPISHVTLQVCRDFWVWSVFTGQEGSRSLSDVGTDFTRDSNIPGLSLWLN